MSIKNEQIAGAFNLGSFKEKLLKKKEVAQKPEEPPAPIEAQEVPVKAVKAKRAPKAPKAAKAEEKPIKAPKKKKVKEAAAPDALSESPAIAAPVEIVTPPVVEEAAPMPPAPPEPIQEVPVIAKKVEAAPEPIPAAIPIEEKPQPPKEEKVVLGPVAQSPYQGVKVPQRPRREEPPYGRPYRRDERSDARQSNYGSTRPQPVRLQTVTERPPVQRPGQRELVRPVIPGDRPGDRGPSQRPRYDQSSRPTERRPYEGRGEPYRGVGAPPQRPGQPGQFERRYDRDSGGGPGRPSRPPYAGEQRPFQRGPGAPYGTRPARPYDRPGAGPRSYPGGGRPDSRFGAPAIRTMEPPQEEGRRFSPEQRRMRDEAEARERQRRENQAGRGAKKETTQVFDARARHGFISTEDVEGVGWRSRKRKTQTIAQVSQEVVRPSKIKVRLPISIKDLAQEMKLKASEIIAKLFVQGMIVTLNDVMMDPDVVMLVGHDFGCEIAIDTSEEERIRISAQSVREEIASESTETLQPRAPVIAFMGHVDHGKTSLIDAIRSSNRAAKEVGAITQHIGAFRCETPRGPITILDTPGHEAFMLMRERGANCTDIVILVIAGDEGIQEQTIEAIKQAKKAHATILVAITKSDKPNFDADRVYRQLADQELLPEIWGGQTVTVNCSAVTKAGINELLEMIALQAEMLELRSNPQARARGIVIESQMQQGLGAIALVLVQNGTLHPGDALVFGTEWAKVKTLRDENGRDVTSAGPSMPAWITGLSGLPFAGDEFIVVPHEKEAKEIAEVRREDKRDLSLQKKRLTVESFMESGEKTKKVLNIMLRADVQGSVEALAKAIGKIESTKAETCIVSQGVGQISESDVALAATSKAIILGFHTSVEAHAEPIVKEMGIRVMSHDIIYHAVDAIKAEMKALLDKIPVETQKGTAEVKALFKSSHLGTIAGCLVVDGVIQRSNQVRLKRNNEVVWNGTIASLKRVKEDVKEVAKGIECGILLQGAPEVQVGDMIEALEITYIDQEL